METKKTKILNIVDIEVKFSAAKRLAEYMGIVDGWATLKANKIVLDSTGVDCLDMFGIPKWAHETLTERDSRIVQSFLINCCENIKTIDCGDGIALELIYNHFKEYCFKTNCPYIHKKLFIKALSGFYNVNNLEDIRGISLKEDIMSDQDTA